MPECNKNIYPDKAQRKLCLVSDYMSKIFRVVGRQTFFFIKTFLYGKSMKSLKTV